MGSGNCRRCEKTTEASCPRCHHFSCADCTTGPNECCEECERDWAIEVAQIKAKADVARFNFPRAIAVGTLLMFVGLWSFGGLLGLGFSMLGGLLIVTQTRVALKARERAALKKAHKRFFNPAPPRAQLQP